MGEHEKGFEREKAIAGLRAYHAYIEKMLRDVENSRPIGDFALYCGDARSIPLPDQSAQTAVTSPPYFGLRDYGHPGQIGLEKSPAEYVANLVTVCREIRRVLRDDGTLWLNLGDSYASSGNFNDKGDQFISYVQRERDQIDNGPKARARKTGRAPTPEGLKAKDLIGIPWRTAFALQADGWYLRSDIIWAKPNPLPESVIDRPTKAHEYLFLLSKSERYFYNSDAIKEKAVTAGNRNLGFMPDRAHAMGREPSGNEATGGRDKIRGEMRNSRSVWTIQPVAYPGAHFATFPRELARRCILAGSKPGDLVIDPFAGSGTTGVEARELGRRYLGGDINPTYVELSRQRVGQAVPPKRGRGRPPGSKNKPKPPGLSKSPR
jgi:DNA modification methylase